MNVPTRFASNFFVVRAISDSRQALQQAVGAESWTAPNAPGASGTGAAVKEIIERAHAGSDAFWEDVKLLIELLQPFSDAVHQIEADRPMLGQCHTVVFDLHKHVRSFAEKHKALRNGSVVQWLEATFQRRFDAVGGGMRAPVYNVAYTAAFVLDPYNAARDETGVWQVPELENDLLERVIALVERVGGAEAGIDLRRLVLGGYPAAMGGFVAVVAKPTLEAAEVAAAGPHNKRARVEMPLMSIRVQVWKKAGKIIFPKLTSVATRLLCCHATTCSTERNWSLWGRVYTASRNALGMERAKKLIALCTNTRKCTESDFEVSLSVVEGEVL